MSCRVGLGPLCVYCLSCSFYMSRTPCYVAIFTDFPQVAPYEDFALLTFVPLSPLDMNGKLSRLPTGKMCLYFSRLATLDKSGNLHGRGSFNILRLVQPSRGMSLIVVI